MLRVERKWPDPRQRDELSWIARFGDALTGSKTFHLEDIVQLSIRHGFAFLCLPKCASTSIEAALRPICKFSVGGDPDLKHLTATGYTKYIVPMLDRLAPKAEIETFCMTREPVDRIESWYRFRMRAKLKNPNHPRHQNYTGELTFNEFIEAYVFNGKLSDQYEFMSSENGEIGIERIFPVDRIALVSEFLTEKTKQNVEIPTKNVSPKKNDIELDPDLRKRLEAYLRHDIVIYNFVKEKGSYDKREHFSELSALLNC